MVASGLTGRVEVSQYRLAFHLTLACAIYAALVWTARSLAAREVAAAPWRIRLGALALVALTLLQIYLGALVAGLRAGRVYNTWPLIDGSFIPARARLFFDTPWWRNVFENALTAQFDHRMLAYVIFIAALAHAFRVTRLTPGGPAGLGAIVLAVAVTLQMLLGIFTLL